MAKTLGLDLGTNSIGWAIRTTIPSNELKNQIEKYGVVIFEKGVGEGKSGEFSFAAERTKKRSSRRLYQARKYRLWKTLEILIEKGYCPLTMEGLNRWRKYDKVSAFKGEGGRAYPVEDKLFDSWIKLDFDNDGKPEYTSPYQLRAELIEKRLDLSKAFDRFKIGRALYHIAQRRGFKSSRKDAVADDAGERQDAKSEQKKETEFENSLQRKFGKSLTDFPTMGAALAFIEKQGERVRLEWIQHTFRKHYKEECTKIFEFQGIGIESELYKLLIEDGKNRYNKAIFLQRPLRSQKGLVGTCTLEKGKSRCPVSHPEFEEFRALAFLNNVQYKKNGIWESLPENIKTELYQKLFFRASKPHFHFLEIREFLEKALKTTLYNRDDKEMGIEKSINYSDKTNVSACPVSARLKDIFGEQWKEFKTETKRVRKNKKGIEHTISYSIEDIWHVLFSFSDEEIVAEFALEKLGLDETIVKKFVTAWRALPEGYAMLSLHAIKKINEFLREGFIYTEAVLLANIPTIIGEKLWSDPQNQNLIKESIASLIDQNRQDKLILGIVNGLTAKYKSLHDNEKFGFKDNSYTLTESDKKEILTSIIDAYGERTWEQKVINKTEIIETVTNLFQFTFRNGFETKLFGEDRYHIIPFNDQTYYKSASHQFYKLPRVVDTIIDFLRGHFTHVSEAELAKLYHPSMVEFYPPAPRGEDGKFYLQSPKIGAFKNPMAMRTLHELRKLVNYLIKTNQIDEETRIVVETARELNDANKRWAIEAYQRQHQAENNEYIDAIRSILENKEYTTAPNPDNSDDIDKVRLWYEQVKLNQMSKGKGEYGQNKWTSQTTDLFQNLGQAKSLLEKYKLWKDQKCICMYTGRIISISDLFDTNKVDFEHTIPRSISFDNSLANRTVCFAKYNRFIKKNQIPTQLPNYEKDITIDGETYQAIKPRLKDWEDKVAHLKSMTEFWKGKSKTASTKDYKDEAIRQRHLWQMDLDYWQNKLERFTMTEVKTGFKNSQLVDTQLISKYAMHYMRSAFNTVDVQKGTITAEFRKILGIQATYEKKSRAKHSHHAIDATVLTLIPYAAKREKILQLAYLSDEEKKLEHWETYDQLKKQIEVEVKRLELPDVNTVIDEIDSQILINNIARDQTLVPGKKIVRRRGKIVYLRDKNGNILKDANGTSKPKIAQGDCIRGELHKDTFLGAIKLPKKNEEGFPIIQEGKFIYDDTILYVVREPLLFKKDATSPGFKSLEDLKTSIVDLHLFKIIEKQIGSKNFKDALQDGIFMYDKKGNKVNKIRHVRVFVRDKEPLKIKIHLQQSTSKIINVENREHKRYYYAGNGENYAYALYQGIIKNKIERDYRIINLFETASLKKIGNNKNLIIEPEIDYDMKGNKLQLYSILKIGLKVIFYKNDSEELEALEMNELSKRIYKIIEFEKDGRIKFRHHLNAQKDEELGKGDSSIDYLIPKPKLRLSKDNFNFIIENKDFEISADGQIVFL